jgi:hypothetical protein
MGIYWALGVMVTIVWYIPMAVPEIVFTICVIMISMIFFSYSVSTISTILLSIESKNKKYRDEIQLLNRFIRKNNIEGNLKLRM